MSETTRLLITSMISIMKIRAEFYHDDHFLSEIELRDLINHLRHQWISTELTPKQNNLAIRRNKYLHCVGSKQIWFQSLLSCGA